jgi:peptidoglycan hydrolase-like protein with peptidoglycan-binding domain
MKVQKCLEQVRSAWKVLKNYYKVAPMIYTSERVWREELSNPKTPDLTESPLWLKHYPFKKGPARRDAAVTRSDPPVPVPWGDPTNWWIHQYQGDAIGLPGFAPGNVDMNRFNAMDKGATGHRVKWVQRRLGIAEGGTFDAATETALSAFQRRNGLPEIPTIDLRTFAHLCWSNP